MLLNGAEIHAKGKLKPFHDSLETELAFTFDNIDLAYYAFHSPVPLPIDVIKGELDCKINLSYLISANQQPRLLLDGQLALHDIDFRELDGRNLFTLPAFSLNLNWADIFSQEYDLTSINITAPTLYVDRDSSGLWNFQRIMQGYQTEPDEPANVEPESAESTSLPNLTIKGLTLSNGLVKYSDDFIENGHTEEITAINLQLDNVSTQFNQKTDATLSLQNSYGFTTTVMGKLGTNPVTADININSSNLTLKPYYSYLAQWLNNPLAGTVNLAGNVVYTEAGNLLLKQGNLELNELLVPFIQKDQFTLASLNVLNTTFDLQQQTLSIGAIKVNNGNITATKLADGSFSPLKLLRETPTADESTSTDAAESGEQKPWDITVNDFDLQKFKVQFSDDSATKKPNLTINNINFQVGNLHYPQSTQSPFNLTLKIGKKGTINLSGLAEHTPLQVQLNTQVDNLALANFNDFVPDNLNLSLDDGKLSSTFKINLNQQTNQLRGNFSGKINITNFNLRDPLDKGKLLTWEKLNIAGINGSLEPFSLQIKELSIDNYLANIQIDQNGQMNLTNIASSGEQEETASTPEHAEDVTADAGADSEQVVDIRVDSLILQGGTVSFIDRSIAERFSATMYNLGGNITGLASAPEMQADVDLHGELEKHSPLTIRGKINPLSQDLFADLSINFKDIDLTPMTPYSGIYIGQIIDKGKLYLDLNYHVENRKVTASNKVLIDQFNLGKGVESDKATSLPVGLAVSLLKDNNDEIHLDIPVSGNLDDPDFSIAGTVFSIIKNLLVKAATSPFSLLSAMAGSGDDFSQVTFDSGRSNIDAEQTSKLEALAQMLVKRPSISLEISGFIDPTTDPEGYRQEKLRQMMVAMKQQQIDNNVDSIPAEEITISTEEYPELLLAVYREAEFKRQRNFVGILKKIPETEMEKLLLDHIDNGEEEMQELAKARAIAVRTALVAVNEEIKPRLFLKKTAPENETELASKVVLTITQ